MKRNKIIAADEAVRVILNNDTVAISGFGGTGVPTEVDSTRPSWGWLKWMERGT